ncbi:hypothetical protein MASR1M66_22980 [Aminivibrio sp.]
MVPVFSLLIVATLSMVVMRIVAMAFMLTGLSRESALPREGVLVLGISRPGGVYLGAPGGEDRITAGDTLILYSALTRVQELDRRRAGEEGESAHGRAMLEHLGEIEKDRETDPPDKKKSYIPRK